MKNHKKIVAQLVAQIATPAREKRTKENLPPQAETEPQAEIFLYDKTLLIILPESSISDEQLISDLQAAMKIHKQERFYLRMIRMRSEDYQKLIHTFTRVFGVFPKGFSSREGLYYTIVDHDKARRFGLLEEENIKKLEKIEKERLANKALKVKGGKPQINRKVGKFDVAA
jgi:hypothetical protein